jgi:uncharacterized cupin superfamily protein
MLLSLALGIAISLPAVASSEPVGGMLKLETDGSAAPQKNTLRAGSFDVVAATYGRAHSSSIGYSQVDGKQYSIVSTDSAEVVHVSRGEVSYVDEAGELHHIQQGDIFFLAPGTSTARDAVKYIHQYIVFPFSEAAAKKLPKGLVIDPQKVARSGFKQTPIGREYTYFESGAGSRVLAWLASARGEVEKTPNVEFIAVKSGAGVFREGNRQIRVAAGDTLYVPPGSSYSWQARDLVAVVVTVGPEAGRP